MAAGVGDAPRFDIEVVQAGMMQADKGCRRGSGRGRVTDRAAICRNDIYVHSHTHTHTQPPDTCFDSRRRHRRQQQERESRLPRHTRRRNFNFSERFFAVAALSVLRLPTPHSLGVDADRGEATQSELFG